MQNVAYMFQVYCIMCIKYMWILLICIDSSFVEFFFFLNLTLNGDAGGGIFANLKAPENTTF